MEECHCSKIAIMQLFHELKQQFPALPDHVVFQCIAQNSHDKDTCARSLRATQESRSLPATYPLGIVMNQETKTLPRWPQSLDVDDEQQRKQRFFEDNSSSSSELNVNVPYSQATTRNVAAPIYPYEVSILQQSPIVSEPTTRGFTSVNLTLRPPSSEPQPPIDINSQGSNLTYSSSSVDSRGFQSRLQIDIGHGSTGGVTSSRIKPIPTPQRPNSLIRLPHNPAAINRSPGLLATLPSHSLWPMAMSASTTPSVPGLSTAIPTNSLSMTPLLESSMNLEAETCTPVIDDNYQSELPVEFRTILDEVPIEFKLVVTDQLIKKDRMVKALEAEKIKLESLRKEVEYYTQYAEKNISPEEIEQQLRNEIHQLQLECDRLAEEVDRKSDHQVPLGETNEEFYQSIYTGQQYVPQSLCEVASAVPSQLSIHESPSSRYENQEESDGPSWVCQRCTFDNHPLMNKCEQCDMPKFVEDPQDETQDIHI